MINISDYRLKPAANLGFSFLPASNRARIEQVVRKFFIDQIDRGFFSSEKVIAEEERIYNTADFKIYRNRTDFKALAEKIKNETGLTGNFIPDDTWKFKEETVNTINPTGPSIQGSTLQQYLTLSTFLDQAGY